MVDFGHVGPEIPASRDISAELALLIDGATNHAIYMLDPHGRVAIWNKGAERIKGWCEAEIVGKSAEIFYLPEDIASGKMRRDLIHARTFGKLEDESLRVRKDGSRFLASVTITALNGGDGRFKGFGKVIRDITDERAAQTEIASSQAKLLAILTTVPDAMIVTDENRIVHMFSTAAEIMFGYASSEIVGQPARILSGWDKTLPKPACRADGQPASWRSLGRRSNGEIFPIEATTGLALLGETQVTITFVRDLTEHDRIETELRDLRDELLHVSRVSAMGAMATTLAHELNQPITAIANYTAGACDLIDRHADPLPGLLAEALHSARDEALRAGAIIRRLRDFVSRGDLDKQACDLPALIREACLLTSVSSDGITVGFDFAPVIEPVLADRIQIQQLLTNLIRNSVDAMLGLAAQHIDIAVTRHEYGMARVTITDSGIGFQPDMEGRMFDFFSGSKSDGMGVGLAICRTIVEAHGGRIWIDTGRAAGASVSFTLPLIVADPARGG